MSKLLFKYFVCILIGLFGFVCLRHVLDFQAPWCATCAVGLVTLSIAFWSEFQGKNLIRKHNTKVKVVHLNNALRIVDLIKPKLREDCANFLPKEFEALEDILIECKVCCVSNADIRRFNNEFLKVSSWKDSFELKSSGAKIILEYGKIFQQLNTLRSFLREQLNSK